MSRNSNKAPDFTQQFIIQIWARTQNLWLCKLDFIWTENRQENGWKATCWPPLGLKLQLGWWRNRLQSLMKSLIWFLSSPSWLRLPLPAALPQTLKALSFTLSTVKTLSFLFLSLLKKTVFLSVWFLCPESSSFSVLFSSYLPLRFSLSPSPLFCSRSSSHSISLSLSFPVFFFFYSR